MPVDDNFWKTKDGRTMPIARMENSHLLNTIRMLRRKSPIGTMFKTTDVRRREWLNAMANEAYRRGLTIDPMDENDPVHE